MYYYYGDSDLNESQCHTEPLVLFSYLMTSASPLQMDQSAQMSVATSVTARLWKAINKSASVEKHCLHFSKISILKA